MDIKDVPRELTWWGLERFLKGEKMTLYHGTTRLFRTFDLRKSRDLLVNRYYGRGIFLTPSKRVAEKYAFAARNFGLEQSVIHDLKRRNIRAGLFLEALVKKGRDAWDDYSRERLGVEPGQSYIDELYRRVGRVDANTIQDVADYVVGSKTQPLGAEDTLSELYSILTATPQGTPDWVYRSLKELGLNPVVYQPKVYTVEARAQRVLVTNNREQARRARSKGYDAVVYYGVDLVDDVPEIAVFDPQNAKIKAYEVV